MQTFTLNFKIKVVPGHAMKAHRILAVYLRTFLTSALDGNGQYATYLGRFNIWERAHGTH